jgi:hypothetical protein
LGTCTTTRSEDVVPTTVTFMNSTTLSDSI